MGRGLAWSQEEEVTLCRAALRVIECPLVGTDQKQHQFDAGVREDFVSLAPQGSDADGPSRWRDRPARAAVMQWKSIKASCMKFYSAFSLVERAGLSGDPSEEELRRVALMFYNKKGTLADAYEAIRDASKDIGPKFPHESSYAFLSSRGVLEARVMSKANSQESSEDVSEEVKCSEQQFCRQERGENSR